MKAKCEKMAKAGKLTALAVSGTIALSAAVVENEGDVFSLKKAGLSEELLRSFEVALNPQSESENQELLAFYNVQESINPNANSLYTISSDWARAHDAGPSPR